WARPGLRPISDLALEAPQIADAGGPGAADRAAYVLAACQLDGGGHEAAPCPRRPLEQAARDAVALADVVPALVERGLRLAERDVGATQLRREAHHALRRRDAQEEAVHAGEIFERVEAGDLHRDVLDRATELLPHHLQRLVQRIDVEPAALEVDRVPGRAL